MSYQENPGGAATGPRGSTVAKWPSRVEVAEQTTEVALVGAVAVQQQQEAIGSRSPARRS